MGRTVLIRRAETMRKITFIRLMLPLAAGSLHLFVMTGRFGFAIGSMVFVAAAYAMYFASIFIGRPE